MARTLRSGLAAAAVFGFCAVALGQSDECSSAPFIAGYDTFFFDLTNATTGAEGQNNTACDAFGGTGIPRDVWLIWTASAAEQVTMSTCDQTSVDTKIAVYEGLFNCPTAMDTPIACDDDTCSLQSEVTFTTVPGQVYLIQIGKSALQGGTGGTGNLVISSAGSGGGADSCVQSTSIMGEGQFAFDTTMATTGFDGQDFTGCSITGMIHNDQWFCWTPTQDGFYTVSTCGSSVDTKLAVYEDFVCACPFDVPFACNDDGCGTQSTVTFAATQFSVYMIQVGNAVEGMGGAGTLTIEIAQGSGSDECVGAEQIAGTGTFAFDNTLATTSFDGQDCTSGAINNDLWFSWTAPSTGVFRVETCGLTTWDTELAVYEGPTCPGLCIAGNDQACDNQSRVMFNAVQDQVYLIQVGSFLTTTVGGPGAFSITEFIPVANDECTTADAISGVGSFAFDTTTATTGSDGQGQAECVYAGHGNRNNDVWFLWTAPSTATFTVETCGTTTLDSRLAAYDGGACPPTTLLSCNDDACGLQSRIEFTAVSGQQYLIQVGAFGTTAMGFGDIIITELLPPANDACAAAQTLFEASPSFGTFEGAIDEGTTSTCTPTGRDVWYRFAPSMSNTEYRVTVDGPAANVDIFNGCPSSGGVEIACSTSNAMVFDSGANAEVWIRVAVDAGGGTEFDIVVDIPPPGDECGTAIPVTGLDPVMGDTSTAGADIAPTCVTGDGTGGGIWYEFVGYGSQTTVTTCNPGTNYDTKLRVYEGTCGMLECVGGNDDGSPLGAGVQDPACFSTGTSANRASTVSFFAEAGVTYYILVHGFSTAEGSYELTFDLGLPEGACCIDGGCEMTVEIDCTARGGVYAGDATSCTEFSYTDAGAGSALENIAANPGATELTLANNSGQEVPIGFTFNFYGAAQTMVGVSDNGYISFGGPLNVAANVAIPNAAAPNALIAPLWDDFNPAMAGAGCTGDAGIHYQTLGSAPNRRFIVQWTSLSQHDVFGRCLDSNTFQVVLFESGDVEFRYGAITPQGTPGDYTVGMENSDGTAGVVVDAASLTSNSSIRFNAVSPDTVCSGGPATCTCEADGNSAQVDVFDLLAYLDLWFASASGADIDGTPGVDVFDLLSFLDCWFPASAGAPCP